MHTVEFENLKVTWIQDNWFDRILPIDLFPAATPELLKELNLENGIPSSISVFLVETEGLKILVDSGLGAPESLLIPTLKKLNTEASDINYVYITHFHADHIGGLLKGDEIVFKNATVYMPQDEYDAWMTYPEDKKEQVVKTVQIYGSKIKFFNVGDKLPGNITALDCHGHTPGQTIFDAGKLLICADLIHGLALQKDHPDICAKYDINTEKAIEKRKYFLQYAKEHDLLICGAHFPAPGFFKP